MTRPLAPLALLLAAAPAFAQLSPTKDNGPIPDNHKYGQADSFRELTEILPTPNDYRTASGAPGHEYWQQRADYTIKVTLDEPSRKLTGSETIVYHNNSPDRLEYLWLQLDANLFTPGSLANLTATGPSSMSRMSFEGLKQILAANTFDGGFKIGSVKSGGEDLPHTIVDTMMRVDLPEPLAPGDDYTFSVDWSFALNDSEAVGGRTGYETLDDGNDLFNVAQWFPRMCVYGDAVGWQHKQYYGRGEFALELGDYDVTVTLPADLVVSATGVLQNPRRLPDPDPAGPSQTGRDRREARLRHHPGGGEGGRQEQGRGRRDEVLAVDGGQRPRLRLYRLPQSHLGRLGPHDPRRRDRDRRLRRRRRAELHHVPEPLPQRLRAALEPVQHAGRGPHRRGLQPVHLPVPVPDGGQRVRGRRRRDGVPDDLL